MANTNGQRSWPRRIIYGSLWAVGFFVFTRIVIGAIVGYIAGLNVRKGNFEAGAAIGYWASACVGNVSYWVLIKSTLGAVVPGFGKGNTLLAVAVSCSSSPSCSPCSGSSA